MIYVITSPCQGTCDTACVDVCPVECIAGPVSVETLRETTADGRGTAHPGIQLFIDPDECTGCGACLPECPVEAIFAEDDMPAEHAGDVARNAQFFRDR
jgi:NAD-dependent dihydropyrimidine dehydrogenase PreA subunit